MGAEKKSLKQFPLEQAPKPNLSLITLIDPLQPLK